MLKINESCLRNTHPKNTPLWVVLGAVILGVLSCGKQEEKASRVPTAPPKPLIQQPKPALPGTTLLLSQVQFSKIEDETGKSRSIPGSARLVIVTRTESGWSEEILEDAESNVFHKAVWFKPASGDAGILTIGADAAFLKIWRKNGTAWASETLWNPVFGGKHNRLRDFEIADLNGDGNPDIAVATHDQGVLGILTWKEGRYQPEELGRKSDSFVHEIEIGDVDGDGITEIFTTPSKPNKLDGSIQPGEIEMWKHKEGKWTQRIVELLETRHAKEILCTTLDGENRPVLIASLEGERIGKDVEGDSTKLRLYRFQGEEITMIDIANLPGKLCRFLNFGDTDGNGKKELIASTNNSGIWKLEPSPEATVKEWKKTVIASGTSGFEHATFLFDSDGDGIQEIFVASDDQKEIRRYAFTERGYSVEVLGKLKESTITWNITVFQAEPGHSAG